MRGDASAAGRSADCAEICGGCGEICSDCANDWCDHCMTCGDCSGDTVCPSCGMTCEMCGNFAQCRQCWNCAECADICVNCGDACSICDAGFNETFHLCSDCNVHDVQVSVVIARIDAIDTVEYTSECKAKIDAATAAYHALTPEQQQLVTNVNTLRNAGRVYNRLKAAEDRRKANLTISGISNIGVVTYTGECHKKIAMARKLYALLNADQKALVTNYDVLVAAEARYAELKAAANATAADQAAAAAATDKINAIGTVAYTDACQLKIDKARAAYNSLTAEQKKLVTNYATLTAAETKYAALKAAADKVAADKAAAADATARIDAIGTVAYTDACKLKINAARAAYDALTADQKALVTNSAVLTAAEAKYAELKAAADQAAADKAAIDDALAKINAIGAVEYTAGSKAKIDAARKAYDALTAGQKTQITHYDYAKLTTAETKYAELKAKADQAAADKAAADAATAQIGAIGTVENTAGSKAKIDAARAAYDALTAEQKKLVTNYAALKAAEAEYAAVKAAAEQAASDKAAADAVIAKIDAIGTVAYTSASKTKINDARVAYTALTEEGKALVTNYGALTAAEEAYAALKAKNPDQPRVVYSVAFDADVTLLCKKSVTLAPVVQADPDASCKTVFSSSNEKVATVDENGVVFGVKRGTATVTCTVTDETGVERSAQCTVTVRYTWWQWIIVILLFGWLWY